MSISSTGTTSIFGAVNIATGDIVTSAAGKSFRATDDSGYISFFNSANDTRNGYGP